MKEREKYGIYDRKKKKRGKKISDYLLYTPTNVVTTTATNMKS